MQVDANMLSICLSRVTFRFAANTTSAIGMASRRSTHTRAWQQELGTTILSSSHTFSDIGHAEREQACTVGSVKSVVYSGSLPYAMQVKTPELSTVTFMPVATQDSKSVTLPTRR